MEGRSKVNPVDAERRARFLKILNEIEVELGMRSGFLIDWKENEIDEEIANSFDRLRDFTRGYLGVDPNG